MNENKNVLAECLITYPNEDDMQEYCDGIIDEPSEVKIYVKGTKYFVREYTFNPAYFRIIEPKQYET